MLLLVVYCCCWFGKEKKEGNNLLGLWLLLDGLADELGEDSEIAARLREVADDARK